MRFECGRLLKSPTRHTLKLFGKLLPNVLHESFQPSRSRKLVESLVSHPQTLREAVFAPRGGLTDDLALRNTSSRFS